MNMDELPHRRVKLLEAALRELCELKTIKDTQGKTADYEARQPKAWQTAFDLLGMTLPEVDAFCPSDEFERGKPDGPCEGTGHYLCAECRHRNEIRIGVREYYEDENGKGGWSTLDWFFEDGERESVDTSEWEMVKELENDKYGRSTKGEFKRIAR